MRDEAGFTQRGKSISRETRARGADLVGEGAANKTPRHAAS